MKQVLAASTVGRARITVTSSAPATRPLLKYQRSALVVVGMATVSTELATLSVMPVMPEPMAAWVAVKPPIVGLAGRPPSNTSHLVASRAEPPNPSENRIARFEMTPTLRPSGES